MKFLGFWTHSSRERGLFRAWLHRSGSKHGGDVAYIEVACPSHSWCSFGATIGGDEHGLKFHACLLRVGVYWGLAARWFSRRVRPQDWSFSIGDGRIRVECGASPRQWSRSQPWWWSMSIEPAQILFGRMRHSEREVSTTKTVIPMPEGPYQCVVTLKLERWQRARLPWASRKVMRGHVQIEGGVPVPGKGENSWDCDDDAIYSQTAAAKSVEQAVANVVESALRTRRRYGGSVNWQADHAVTAR